MKKVLQCLLAINITIVGTYATRTIACTTVAGSTGNANIANLVSWWTANTSASWNSKGGGLMNVLVACEESQEVCKAFRAKGHNAFSCDIQECSGGRPEWHIMFDVSYLLNTNCIQFITQDMKSHFVDRWDMIIAFPPCTDLAVSGARHFERKRKDGSQQRSIDFFLMFTNLECDKVAIENPVGIMSTVYRKPDQIIQPFEYGHAYTKKTCLWLKGLPKLTPTDILEKPKEGWVNQCFTNGRYSGFNGKFSGKKNRSKTFPGIAKAMANQWG